MTYTADQFHKLLLNATTMSFPYSAPSRREHVTENWPIMNALSQMLEEEAYVNVHLVDDEDWPAQAYFTDSSTWNEGDSIGIIFEVGKQFFRLSGTAGFQNVHNWGDMVEVEKATRMVQETFFRVKK